MKLQQEYTEKSCELDNKRAELHADIESRKQALDDRAAKINDRENVHERRRLYTEFKNQLGNKAKNPSLTPATEARRTHVWTLSGILGAFALAVFAACLHRNLLAEKINWVAVGGQVASGLTLVGTVTYLIQWQNAWFQSHADEEYRLKRLELDIERASWIVELALEWEASAEKAVPPELLATLSAGLFSTDPRSVTDIHPLETLRSGALGASWFLKLKPDGAELASGESAGKR